MTTMTVDYRYLALAHFYVIISARVIKMYGRKAWLGGRIETLEDLGTELTLVAEAKTMYIEPK